MKVSMTAEILDYEGKPLKNGEKNYTARDAISFCLNSQMDKEILTSEQKSKIFQLSQKIYGGNEPDLTVDDRAFIKERAGMMLTPVAFGRIAEMLEEPKKEE